MAVHALFVLESGIAVVRHWQGSAAMARYQSIGIDVPVSRLRSRTHLPTDTTYEIYAEPMIPESEALRRAAEWNERFPHEAVPPAGLIF